MTIVDILKQGVKFTNADDTAKEMLADFKDHKVGMKLDAEEITVVVKDGVVSLESGIRDDCHAVMSMKIADMCGAIDNSFDLMEIREKGELLKGDMADPNIAVHFMATFPFFDTMVRFYEDDSEFKKQVDDLKSSL